MNYFYSALFALLGLCSVQAAELPPEFEAVYVVKKGFIKIGEARRSLKRTNDSLTFVSDSKTTGFIGALFREHIVQTTHFRFEDNVVKPNQYLYDRNKGEKIVTQNYDWQTRMVKSQRGKELFEYKIPDKTQDQSSYQLALMLDLADGLRNFTYHIAENVKLVDYDVNHRGRKSVKTIFGKLDAEIMHVKNKNGETTIWCAKKLRYLPVKIEYIEDGVSFEAVLEQLQGLSIN